MRVFIVEKNSVTTVIAKVLAKREGVNITQPNNCTLKVADNYLVALAGHALTTNDLRDYKGWENFRWSELDRLPFVPSPFLKKVNPLLDNKGKPSTAKNDERIRVLRDYLNRADEVINVGDADDEGQYLVDELLEFIGYNKPVKRMWFSSLEDKFIEKALDNLQDNNLFKKIGLAAQARSEADWIVGINNTILTTSIYRQSKKSLLSDKSPVSVGRVQTAVLNLIRQREKQVDNFTSQIYYKIFSDLKTPQGDEIDAELNTNLAELKAKLIDSGAMNDKGQIISKDEAERICRQFAKFQQLSISSLKIKEKKEQPDLPFSLSRLQQHCGQRFDMKAKEVLDIASNLYLSKLITYPRNNGCCHISVEAQQDVPAIVGMIRDLPIPTDVISKHDLSLVDETYLGSKCWDDDEVNKKSHPAIIPTAAMTGDQYHNLDPKARQVYNEIVKFYLYQFMKPAESLYMTADIIHPEEKELVLNITKKSYTARNWREAFGEYDDKDMLQPLPVLNEGDNVELIKMSTKDGKTKPPSVFTDSSLINAMEHIYRFIDTTDDPTGEKKQIKDRLRGKSHLEYSDDDIDVDKAIFTPEGGLGTDSTRANILDTLNKRKFIVYSGKSIRTTELGRALLEDLSEDFKEPYITGKWQLALDKIRNANDLGAAELEKEIFFEEFIPNFQRSFTVLHQHLVEQYNYKPDVTEDLGVVGGCMADGCTGEVHRYHMSFGGEESEFLRCNTCKQYHFELDGKLIVRIKRESEHKCLKCEGKLTEMNGVNKSGQFYHLYHCENNKCNAFFDVGENGEPVQSKVGVLTDYCCRLCQSKLRYAKDTKKSDGSPFSLFICDNDDCSKLYSAKDDVPVFPDTTPHICQKCNKFHLVLVQGEKNGKQYKFYSCEDTVNCKQVYNIKENGLPHYPTEHRCNLCDSPLFRHDFEKDGKSYEYFKCANKECGQAFNIDNSNFPLYPELLSESCPNCKKPLYQFTNKDGSIYAGHIKKDSDCKLRLKLDENGKIIPLEICQSCGQPSLAERKGTNKEGKPYHFFVCQNHKCELHEQIISADENGKPRDIYLPYEANGKVFTLLKGTCCTKCKTGKLKRIENKADHKSFVVCNNPTCKTFFTEDENGNFIESKSEKKKSK